jgi:haloalkane dehalogenase
VNFAAGAAVRMADAAGDPEDRDVAMGTAHDVLGSTMWCVEEGAGRPVVFLHGNPTSSYLWRGVLPRVASEGRRLIAVDLIGMGGSGKPAIAYTLGEHVDHVDALLDVLGLDDVVLVGHDWGVAIGLELLRRHPDRVVGIAFMEGHLRPLAGWDDFDPGGRDLFRRLRTPEVGERMVLDENFLLDTLLPAGMLHPPTPADLDVYRRPYPDPVSRRPLLQWTREIPVGGEPARSASLLAAGWENLSTSPVPKLLVHADPGAVVTRRVVDGCRADLPHLTVQDVGAGLHFLPEDRPAEVGDTLASWLRTRLGR